MRVTVTGATGFLGSAILDHLANAGIESKPFSVRFPLSLESCEVPGDILVHCAGIAHATHPDPMEVRQINHELTIQVATWAKKRGYSHFIFLSSALVWNDSLEEIDSEKDDPRANTEYGKAKLSAERDLQRLRDDDFAISIVRLPLVYGPGVKGNLARLIGALSTWPICPLGSNQAKRSLTGVGTLSRFVEHLISIRQGGIFTLVDTPEVTSLEMVRMLAEGMPKHGLIIPAPRGVKLLLDIIRPSVSKRLFGSRVIHDSSVRATDFDPLVSREYLKESFREMALYHNREMHAGVKEE